MIRYFLSCFLIITAVATQQAYTFPNNDPLEHSNHSQQRSLKHFLVPAANIPDEPNAIKTILPSTIVMIDVGHGGIDGGTSYENILEKDINLAVAQKLYQLLQGSQIPVILNRNGDYALSDENNWHRTSSRHLKDLSQRAGLAKQVQHKVFISLHVNSGSLNKATGPVVLHQSTGESAMFASYVQEQLNLFYDTRRATKTAKSFYLLNYVKSPAIIVELGFITNTNDRTKLVNPLQQDKLAKALANGIMHYLWIYQ